MRNESPIWISHRGYKATAVENTAEAFRAARAQGFVALETDLRLTKDGEIVLHHDPSLRRLSGRSDLVHDLTREQLAGIPVGEGGTVGRILFFDEFVEEFAGCAWTFDIKPETGAETLRRLKAWVDGRRAGEWIDAQAKFVCWDARHEALCHELFPRAAYYARERECYRAGAAVRAGAPRFGGILPGRTYALTPRLFGMPLFTREVAAAYHDRGAKLVAFLPESETDARAAAAAGFDEILTNGRIFI